MHHRIRHRVYRAIWGPDSDAPAVMAGITVVGLMAAIGFKMLGM